MIYHISLQHEHRWYYTMHDAGILEGSQKPWWTPVNMKSKNRNGEIVVYSDTWEAGNKQKNNVNSGL